LTFDAKNVIIQYVTHNSEGGDIVNYTAAIEIDDDRWAKHPYGIRIYDEDGNEVLYRSSLDSRESCYRIADRYRIQHSDIEESFY
jgi:uncharacterized protein YrzB (UPF0473 family)